MNFRTIDNAGACEGFCLIKAVEKKTTAKGMAYLDMTVSDASGEMNAKLWDYNEERHGVYAAGDIIKLRGTIAPYNGVDQLRIERIRPALPQDGINPADYVKSTDFAPERMFDEIYALAQSLSDPTMQTLVTAMLDDHKEKMLYWPAAFKLHHAIRGGLLYHTLSIIRLAQNVCKVYTFVNQDLLIAGAILHDIAKLYEFEVTATGIASGYSTEGNLIGHLAKGAMLIDRYAQKLQTPPHTAMLLEHMVLSHHGEPEFGAAVRPQFLEAELLSELDLMDARVYEMREAVSAAATGEFSARLWALDNRKLYNHGTSDLESPVELF